MERLKQHVIGDKYNINLVLSLKKKKYSPHVTKEKEIVLEKLPLESSTAELKIMKCIHNLKRGIVIFKQTLLSTANLTFNLRNCSAIEKIKMMI